MGLGKDILGGGLAGGILYEGYEHYEKKKREHEAQGLPPPPAPTQENMGNNWDPNYQGNYGGQQGGYGGQQGGFGGGGQGGFQGGQGNY